MGPRSSLPELHGALLAGAALGLLAAARLGALPASWLVGVAVGTAGCAALPWLCLGLARRLARRAASAPPLAGLVRGALITALGLGLLDLGAYAALRRLAVHGALLPAEGPFASLARPALLAVAAVALAALGLHAARSIAPGRRRGPWIAGATAALLGLALLAGRRTDPGAAGGAPAPRPGPDGPPALLVVGLDAIGAGIFETYRSAMPNLAAFADQAARGRLVPEAPFLSPALWTSIATGLSSAEHGANNYELHIDGVGTLPIDRFYADPATSLLILPAVLGWRAGWLAVLPTTRLHRRGTAFWEAGGPAAAVCWPATWPAGPGQAWLVSDRWPPDRAETLFHYDRDLPDQVWPPALAADLAGLRRDPAQAPDPEVLAMAPFTPAEQDAFRAALRDDLAAPRDQPFSNLHYAWLNDRSCLDAARRLFADLHPPVAAVYLLGPDLVGHAFLPDAQGRVAGFAGPDGERLAAVYPAYLRRLDQDLAWLLALAGPETTTVVISDHGMVHEGTGLFSVWHGGDGMVLARGPGLAPGQDLGRRPAEGWRDLLGMP